MKNKKPYKFGNSNFRNKNVETKNPSWIHLLKDSEGNLLIFKLHPVDVKSCFEIKELHAKTGNKSKMTNLCVLKCIGQSRINDVKEFFEKSNGECRNIDDYFQVTLHTDREFIGRKLPDDLWLASLAC